MLEYIDARSEFNVVWRKQIRPVYRILNRVEYINSFFDKGELFVSCFENFRKYDDEMQGDRTEGEHLLGGFSDNGDGNFLFYEGGLNTYIMSTTTDLNERVIDDFDGVGAIKINNPMRFGMEMARKLPFVVAGLEGNCFYGDSKASIMETEQEINRKFQSMDFSSVAEMKERIAETSNNIELFMKLNKYKHQSEYRLAWFSQMKVREGIIVRCPEAIQFCEKIFF